MKAYIKHIAEYYPKYILSNDDFFNIFPELKQKKDTLLGEFHSREGDPNLGGMTSKKGVLTSYRQKALKIALYLEKNESVKASVISKKLSEPKARDIMYKNFYGWFDRVSTGVYKLSNKGKNEIEIWLNKNI